MSVKNCIIGGLALLLVLFLALVIYYRVNPPPPSKEIPLIPNAVSSGRYLEFLRANLKLELKIQDGAVMIYLTNKSPNQPIPSEEPHRAVVCTTELIDEVNHIHGPYPEYFRPRPVDVENATNQQIMPQETVKLGYDLMSPHGKVRVRLTYEDFSTALGGPNETAILVLSEQEIKF